METQGVTLRNEIESVNAGWQKLLLRSPLVDVLRKLDSDIEQQRRTAEIMPPRGKVFEALKWFPPEATRVLILGQDPYPGRGDACGLSFSVPKGQKLPGSLRNIFQELRAEYGCAQRTNGDLSDWAKQGVLLLNSVLTVRVGEVASHSNLGWERVTDVLLSAVNLYSSYCVFMLWGKIAQRKAELINASQHCILMAAHPSPLSARRGFFGCGHFKTANDFLLRHARGQVDWFAGECASQGESV